MMNKKIFSLIMAISSINAAVLGMDDCGEKVTDPVVKPTIFVTVKLDKKRRFSDYPSCFMDIDKEQQQNLGMTPNKNNENYYPVCVARYCDLQKACIKNWVMNSPLVVENYCRAKYLAGCFPCDHDYPDLKKILHTKAAHQLDFYQFPATLPESVVNVLEEKGLVTCNNEWGRVVISLANPQPKNIFARFVALFRTNPEVKFQRMLKNDTELQKYFEKNKKDFVVPTWRE